MGKKELKYYNPYGSWTVTTEGDCEGRTTRHLGTFTGYLDEIALHLADKCSYSLTFKYNKPIKTFTPTNNKVNVTLDIDSGSWGITNDERIQYFKEILKDRSNIRVEHGTSYASVILVDERVSEDDLIRNQALKKLTDREKKVLGLK